jgi:MFS family permease
MQQIAVSWLVYQMTHSVFLLGLVGFVSQIPTFAISPFAGVWSDRFNRYRMLIMTQTLSMIQAIILAILVLSGIISVWQIILLSLFIGCVNAIDMPTRQSFVVYMIDDRKDLSNAIALNSAIHRRRFDCYRRRRNLFSHQRFKLYCCNFGSISHECQQYENWI